MSRKISLTYGLIAGVVTVGYYLLLYFSNREGFFNLYTWWAGLVPMLAFMILGTYQLRKVQSDLNLSTALQTSFMIFVLASLFFYVFYYVLLKYLDPDMLRIQQETALENLERFSRGRGDDMEAYEEYYQESGLNISLGTVIFRYLQSLIGGFILSLGIAFVLKRK